MMSWQIASLLALAVLACSTPARAQQDSQMPAPDADACRLGAHGGNPHMQEAWRVLQEFGAEVVVNGHDHDYERFAPQDADGNPDAARGIREFVVGTGGGGVDPIERVEKNSEVRHQ